MARSIVITTLISSLLVVGNASALVKIFIAPGWERSTNSTSDIKSFLSDINNKQDVINDSGSKELNSALINYRDRVKNKLAMMYSGNELDNYKGTVCKISFTTGKTGLNDPTPPSIINLDFLADNKSDGCVNLTKKLKKMVENDSDLKYPYIVKKNGLLSIDLIYVFS